MPLDRYGRIYADEAGGIHVIDRPSPLHQLLVISSLLGARIPAGVAVATTRALVAAGHRTSVAMAEAGWQVNLDTWGCRSYRRLAGLVDTTLPWLAPALVRVALDLTLADDIGATSAGDQTAP